MKFLVKVTQYVAVELTKSKFNKKMMEEFRENFYPFYTLDQHAEHITVHTGQNYDESLSDIFIKDLEVRPPDVHLGIKSFEHYVAG